jgi:large subunit ribosomal protein L17
MRHGKKFNHLSRKSAHRKAMLANMATSLILHKRIETTLAKAKALRTYIEPLITKSKEDTTHSRRVIFSHLQSKEAVTELFRDVSVKVANRPGGYTRIIKLSNRIGDNADMCMMELVDFNENLLGDKVTKAKPTRKRRSAGKKKAEEPEKVGVTEKAEATKKEASADKEAEAKVSDDIEATTNEESNSEDEVKSENTGEESK